MQTQSQFYHSLAKDKTTRNAVLFELCRYVKLISVEPETVLIRQGEGRCRGASSSGCSALPPLLPLPLPGSEPHRYRLG